MKSPKVWTLARLINNVLAGAVAIMLILTIVNGLVPQISIYFFSNSIIPFPLLTGLAMPILLLAIIINQKKVVVRTPLILAVWSFMGYSLAVAGWHLNKLELEYIITGYSSFFYFIFLLSLMVYVHSFLSEKILVCAVLVVAIFTSVLGIAQYTLNDPIVSVGDQIGNFKVLSWLFLDSNPPRVRGFSFFSNALEFGIFLIFCVGVALSILTKRRIFGAAITLLITVAVFCTITRNVYLGMSVAVIASFLYIRIKNNSVLLILPTLSFLLSLAVSLAGGVSSGSGFSSNTTLDARSQYWRREIVRQYKNDTGKLLFGEGIYQTGTETSGGRIFVDNTYLNLIAQQGLIGTLLFLAIYGTLLKLTLSLPKSHLRCGFYGFLVAWPALALFNIAIHHIGLYAMLTLAGSVANPPILFVRERTYEIAEN